MLVYKVEIWCLCTVTFGQKHQNWIVDWSTGMRFASFLSSGFSTMAVMNPLEKELEKCTSVRSTARNFMVYTSRESAGAHLQLRTSIFPLLLKKLFQPILPSITAQLREERRWTCKRNKKEGRTQGRIVQIKCRHLMNQGSFNRSVFLYHTAQTCMYCIICYELCCTIFYFFLKLLKIIRFAHWKGIKKMEIQCNLDLMSLNRDCTVQNVPLGCIFYIFYTRQLNPWQHNFLSNWTKMKNNRLNNT